MDILWPKKTSRFRKILYSVLAFGILVYFLNFRVNIDPTIPAGCRVKSAGYFGGCSSKQSIQFQLSWSMRRCLSISTNNCVVPGIQLHNRCGDQIYFEAKTYPEDDSYVRLDKTGKSGLSLTRGDVGGKPFLILSVISKECK